MVLLRLLAVVLDTLDPASCGRVHDDPWAPHVAGLGMDILLVPSLFQL